MMFLAVCCSTHEAFAGGSTTQLEVGFVARLEFRMVAEPNDKSDADEMRDPDNKRTLRVLKRVELDERDVARPISRKSRVDLLRLASTSQKTAPRSSAS
jgi:hypothetical protein